MGIRQSRMESFVEWMGRRHTVGMWMDGISRLFLPRFAQPAWAGAGIRPNGIGGPVFQAPHAPSTPHCQHGDPTCEGGPSFWSAVWEAVLTQHVTHYDRKEANFKKSVEASTGVCALPQYHGMHGRPCAWAGGSDKHCPAGTVGGWYWSYETALGVICYVDCCGGRALGNIWCNWTSEQNWCLAGKAGSSGNTAYTCTLAIPQGDLKLVSGFVDGID